MLLIGLLWITSWISAVLSLSQNLPPSATTKTLFAKESANFRRVANQPGSLFIQSQQQANFWQTSLLPKNFFRFDWHSQQPQTQPAKLLNLSVTTVKESDQKLCATVPETLVEQPRLQTTNSVLLPEAMLSNPPEKYFFPNQILRSLQTLFNLPNPVDQSSRAVASPVEVINRDDNYQVCVNNRLVANLPNEVAANSLKQRLIQLIQSPKIDPQQLRPGLVDGIPSLMVGNRFLFGINQQISDEIGRSGDLLAIEWINNLRVALNASPLTLVEGQMEMYGLEPSQTKLSGVASWYGDYFHGRLTANGEIYNQNELTVAHRSLPFNTYLQVTNLETGKSVIVRVNDRGPYISPRSLDLSREAARCIESENSGVVPYEAVILRPTAPVMTLKPATVATEKLKPGQKLAIVTDF